MTKKSLSCAEAGKKGGQKTAATHGKEFYAAIANKRWSKIKVVEAQ